MKEANPSNLPSKYQIGAAVSVPADRAFPAGGATVIAVIFRAEGVQYFCESSTGRQQTFDSEQVS